jgi:hypothetical protein
METAVRIAEVMRTAPMNGRPMTSRAEEVLLAEGRHENRADQQERYQSLGVAGDIPFNHVVRPFTNVRRADGCKSLAGCVRDL